MGRKVKNEYLNNGTLLNELIRIRDTSLGYTTELHGMFSLMVDNFSRKFSYKDPMDREDCKAQAIMDCYLYFRSFDPDKGQNAFAYFTQVQKNAFAKGYKTLYPESKRGLNISLSSSSFYSI